MRYTIGIDVGTQALKTLLWQEDGQIVALESEQYPVEYPQPAWAVQNALHWWQAMGSAIPRLCQKAAVAPADVVAIGIDGTVDGFVPISEEGAPLAPAFLWMDRRAVDECEDLASEIDLKQLFEVTGLNLDASHTAAKMLWLRRHEPEVYARSWKFMPPASFIVYMLTRQCVVDYSNASSTMLFDVRSRQWSPRLLRSMQIQADLLPDLKRATEIVGHLTPDAARFLGLCTDTLVVVGCGDEHASCVGAGVIEPGVVADIIGTAEPVCLSTQTPVFDASRLVETHCHAHPERWLLENPGWVSGGNYRWFRDQFCTGSDGGQVSYETLNLEAETAPPGSDGLVFLPCMMGAMAPEWNSKARGVFYGLTLAHTRGHMIRALLEGSAYALRSVIDSMQRSGCDIQHIRAVGGAAQSKLVRQIRADLTGLPVGRLSTSETTVLGAALLAAAGAGLCPGLQEAADRTIHVIEFDEPIMANRTVYEEAYHRFLHVYENLKSAFEL